MDVLKEIKQRYSPNTLAETDISGDELQTNDIPYYAFDAGLSVMSLIIQAEHQGLRVHAMAGYDEKKVRQSLGFKSDQRIVVLLALGHEAEASTIKEKVVSKGKEFITKSRERKPPSENFFLGEYGIPVS
jgi:nitroreductase